MSAQFLRPYLWFQLLFFKYCEFFYKEAVQTLINYKVMEAVQVTKSTYGTLLWSYCTRPTTLLTA